ncbi:NADH dehydrogenase subunit 2 (mitochondrion) [Muscidifurax raptorellus]|uniref:NADH dehydrogenase subunit 2 n=1 Tax=Muscidifurax raptorellus TaxID=51938 RepID=UPI001E7BC1B7|nr:NADH dehydrogenase subunit 2 [Muscidifurax raptorellus]UAT98642.1 NADH dehydrogenase subunit 2 [Muscidifurax raptorellus]
MYLNYYSYILFIPMLIISNFLMLITNSFFSMWMIMEINLISFICLMIYDKNLKMNNLINYFLIQVYNSYMFLLSMILMNYNLMDSMIYLMNLSMLIKMGSPPFYMWYLKLLNNLNWMNIFFLSTLQKIIPLIILKNILVMEMSMIMNLIIMILASMYSSFKGLNELNIKNIFCYSSIIQMSWIMILMMFNEIFCMLYLLIYTLIMLNLCISFNNMNINNIMYMYIIKLNNKFNYYMMNMSIISLAAIPPMFGFLMKLGSIQIMNYYLSFSVMMFLIFNSLISMNFYLRIMFNNLLFNTQSIKLNFKFINYAINKDYKNLMLLFMLFTLLMMYEMI